MEKVLDEEAEFSLNEAEGWGRERGQVLQGRGCALSFEPNAPRQFGGWVGRMQQWWIVIPNLP